ncbi:MAG: hypothetical protein ACR2P2_15435, partial [Nakamurella sp.]
MASAADVIAIARTQIGPQEQAGPNSTKYGIWYGLNPDPWCSMFLAWCGDQAARAQALATHATTAVNPFGDDQNPKGFAFTPSWADFFRQHNEFTATSAGIQTGDIVFFDKVGANRISHVG